MPGGVYTGGGATVVMDPAPLVYHRVFHEGSEPDRYLKRKAIDVALTARVLAPRRTGRLAASIKADQNRDARGKYAFGYSVYTPVYYGYYVHEGTGPSVRETFPGHMSFAGTKRYSGQQIVTDIVHHPGTPANPFLQQALIAMVN